MMLNRQNVANALSIFKWKRRVKSSSSLTATLLKDISSEVELSEYGRVPSSGSESPSGFLNGESLNVEPIADLDLFFERLYSYYCGKGLWCIIIKWVVELLSLGFMICFSGFFLLFVDWNGLRNAKCGMDAVESGTKPCDLPKDALHHYPLTPFTTSKATIVGYLGIFSVYWVFCFLRFFVQLKDILGIRHYYYNRLNVADNEIQTIPWASILEKVVQMQCLERLCVVKDLSEHDVVMRLTRKENYLIGMLNKGFLSFPISQWVPGCGPTVKISSDGKQHRLILTKTLEWSLNWCILQSMFDRNFCVKRDFISSPETLKKRLMVVGLAMLLLSPFLVIFMLVYLFLRHAEQFYNHPSTASSRRWSNLSKWIIREFNEVDHMFKHRMNSSVVHASNYLRQFPSPIISIIAKFISFVSGGFAAILIIIAFLEESLLEGHIFGRNLFWYGAVFGTITAISRAAIADELLVLDPDGAISLLLQHTHYMPKRWRARTNTAMVRIEFETLFQYTGMMLLEEIVSIFLTPYLLLFVVPKRVEDILQFIADFTVHVEGVGHVCSFSVFDFANHGNTNYGSPHDAPRIQRSSQGKLEKSFLSFHAHYPSWEPDAMGKQFLHNLKTFAEQNLQENLRIHHTYSPQAYGIHVSPPHWANPLQKIDSYILDRYYTSRSHEKFEKAPFEVGIWMPPVPARGEFKFNGQSSSHLEASTSVMGGSILRRHESMKRGDEIGASHWWDRGKKNNEEGSFLEPPDFSRPAAAPYSHYDNFSDRSGGEELDWRDSGQKMRGMNFMEDFESEGEEIRPHFGDIYSGL